MVGKHAQLPGFQVGTGCSGSDGAILCLRDIVSLFDGMGFSQRFAVEVDPEKRRWLEVMFPECAALYTNMSHMHGSAALDVK